MKRRGVIVATIMLGLMALGSLLFSHRGTGVLAAAPTTPSASVPAPAGTAVSISNFQFSPKVVRIKVGAEVSWEVKEGTHTVSADDGSFESPNLSAGKKFSHTFSKPGSYRYYCSFHGSKGGHDMAGTVIVSK